MECLKKIRGFIGAYRKRDRFSVNKQAQRLFSLPRQLVYLARLNQSKVFVGGDKGLQARMIQVDLEKTLKKTLKMG